MGDDVWFNLIHDDDAASTVSSTTLMDGSDSDALVNQGTFGNHGSGSINFGGHKLVFWI